MTLLDYIDALIEQGAKATEGLVESRLISPSRFRVGTTTGRLFPDTFEDAVYLATSANAGQPMAEFLKGLMPLVEKLRCESVLTQGVTCVAFDDGFPPCAACSVRAYVARLSAEIGAEKTGEPK